jgi:hypothetical protein
MTPILLSWFYWSNDIFSTVLAICERILIRYAFVTLQFRHKIEGIQFYYVIQIEN